MSNPCCSTRGDAKRQAVIAAAERIFLEQGYASASMDGIAAEAGVSKRTVYNHFASKQDLFQAMVARLYAGLNDTLRRGLPQDSPPEQVLTEFAHELLAHLRRPEVQGLFRLIIAERPRFPELGLSINASGKSTAFALLEDYFAAQHARGALHAPDPWAAANLFVGVLKESAYWPGLLGLPVVEEARAVTAAVEAVMAIHSTRSP
jgi:TetR/AcrR family transcriptional regulator of autoinduction and epiphytic fitness